MTRLDQTLVTFESKRDLSYERGFGRGFGGTGEPDAVTQWVCAPNFWC